MAASKPVQGLPELIKAADVPVVAQTIISNYRAVRDNVAHNVQPTTACFANVIRPLIEVGNNNQGQISMIAMLRYVSPDKAARDASEEALRMFSRSEAEFTARQDLYLLIKAVSDRAEPLDVESQKYVDELLQDFTRCGHGTLEPEQIRQYLDSRNAIDQLRRKFTRNIMDCADGLRLGEDADLRGLSDADLQRFRDETTGGYFIPFRRSDIANVLKYAENPAIRKQLYMANNMKLHENVAIFRDVILRRDSNARMLGYPSHAAFRLEKRVAKTTAWVYQLLQQLQDVLLPQGKAEMDLLLARKREYLRSNVDYVDDHPEIMPPWDLKFYTRLAEEEVNVQHEKIAEYFPLQHTVSRMLDLFADCLQLRFERVAPEQLAPVSWHPDVEAWAVWDEAEDKDVQAVDGGFVGYLYVDLLARENKYRGSQDANLQGSYLRSDGSRVYPATLLMCSFPRPTTTTCPLLQHREVVSLFHELGHGIHDLVARTQYVRFHGWRAPPDFCEAPSVMLENWCWLKDELQRMSCHYTSLDPEWRKDWQLHHPGELEPAVQIPDALLEPLIQSRNHNKALWYLGQLSVSYFDMAVHDVPSHAAAESLDPTALYNDMEEKFLLQPIPDEADKGHPHVHFGHLLSGYDAGYYSYLSAHVFAADMFESAFSADPRSHSAWNRYRAGILGYGGSRDELLILREFIGRPPSPEALLRRLRMPL